MKPGEFADVHFKMSGGNKENIKLYDSVSKQIIIGFFGAPDITGDITAITEDHKIIDVNARNLEVYQEEAENS